MILLLLACFPLPPGGGSTTGREDSAQGGDDGDTGPDDAGETGDTLPDAAELVEAIRADGEAAMARLSTEYGFPVRTADGLLVVSLAPGDWEVAGDYGGWAPEPMSCKGGLCWALITATDGGYKFTDGDRWVADPWSRRMTWDDFGEMSLVASADAHVERWFAVGDADNSARTLHVLVPAEPVTHVLYAEDGQNLFDPEAIWGGWRMQDSAPAGMLIVGIDNTADRFDAYTHVPDTLDGVRYGGEADAYADFVQDTVRPLMRTAYGEPGPVGLLGSSLGGLVSLHIADRHPGEFAFAASMSGTLGWGSIELNNETIIERYAAHGHQSTAIYLDSGGNGTTCTDSDHDGVNDDDATARDNYCETVQMRDVLAAEGYTFDTDLWHWWEPDAEHDEVAWAARVGRPLALFSAL
jgi:predicted alpha/beta superfamily hydrolase